MVKLPFFSMVKNRQGLPWQLTNRPKKGSQVCGRRGGDGPGRFRGHWRKGGRLTGTSVSRCLTV